MNLILRAWLPREKKMLSHDEIDFTAGRVFRRVYDDRTGLMNSFPKDDAILMFNIGLADRKGIPIFNGDIVKKIAPVSTIIGELVIDNGAMIMKTRDYRRDGTQNKEFPKQLDINELRSRYKRYEVIGNIYENPVLLLDYPELLEERDE